MTAMIVRPRGNCPTALTIVLGTVLVMLAWDAMHAAKAGSQSAPWCAFQGGRGGDYDCSYYTFEQCMATARGLGGSCAQNPRVIYGPDGQPRRPRK
jgi:hypothetical protein